jgi:hypothetical protein
VNLLPGEMAGAQEGIAGAHHGRAIGGAGVGVAGQEVHVALTSDIKGVTAGAPQCGAGL